MKKRELCKTNRDRLIEMIENTAVDEHITFNRARTNVIANPENFDLLWNCQQGWYRGKLPSAAVMRKWRNKDKLALARKWPDLTPEEHELAAPYLPVKKRPKHLQRQRASKANADFIRTMHKHGRSFTEIAEMLGVHLSTVYRILKDPDNTRRHTRWTPELEADVRAMLAEGKSRQEIADLLNINVITLYRRIPVK